MACSARLCWLPWPGDQARTPSEPQGVPVIRRLIPSGLHFDWKIVIMTVSSTLLIMVDYYRRLTSSVQLDRLLLYLVIPLAITLFIFREHPREYGFRLGDWKAGLLLTLGGIALIAPVLWLAGRADAATREYYQGWLTPYLVRRNALDLLGWEFIFRGWLLFGYARKFGPDALWLQAVPFALAHLGKPEIETLSTIFGGFAFGLVAWRTRSFVYPFLIHWFVSVFIVLAASGALGVK